MISLDEITEETLEAGECDIPNGCHLWWKRNEAGGRRYISDEIGGGVVVYDSALLNQSTVLAAITVENYLATWEYHKQRKAESHED